jgi:hypothetical protein
MTETTDPCGGSTKGGDGCRCDPPFIWLDEMPGDTDDEKMTAAIAEWKRLDDQHHAQWERDLPDEPPAMTFPPPRRTVRRLIGHLIAEAALTLLDTVVYAAADYRRRRHGAR